MTSHAVASLRADRLARSSKPFLARGGASGARCTGCRLRPSHCLCSWRQSVATRAGICLLMADTEPLKPSNTGWLVADLVPDTFAFGWARTSTDPGLPALLQDPQWQPVVVFPQDYADPARVVHGLPDAGAAPGRRPLFILLDGTWAEARKMFRKTPCLDRLPVLHLNPDRTMAQRPRYQLRRGRCDDHFCTSEVAALCLDMAGDHQAALLLQAYLDVFTHHYLQARHQLPVDLEGTAHQRLQALRGPGTAAG